MMRSLFGGVSGLRNHQVMMDVIGNNIANVNTVAYKSGRVTFKDSLYQTMQGAQRPLSNRGGVNPMQVGLGMGINSIDSNFSQGTLESTGQITDLALEGDGFFMVNDGSKNYYTRAGNFNLDASGRMVAPNGYTVQGRLADTRGVIPQNAPIEDLILPFGASIPAQATTEVELQGNLDANGEALGTILEADSMYAIEDGTTDIEGLLRGDNSGTNYGKITGMSPNATSVTVDDGTNSVTYTYVSTDPAAANGLFNSLNDLIAEINADFGAAGFNTMSAALNAASGVIDFTDLSGTADLTIDSTNVEFERALSAANGLIGAGTSTEEFAHVATDTDLVEDLRNRFGVDLGFTGGETITINADVGGTAITPASLNVVAGTTTYGDYQNSLESALGISNSTGVEIDQQDGSLIVNGDGGTVNEITNLDVTAGVANFDAIYGNGFWAETQEAEDFIQNASITVYDSIGDSHVLTFTFTKNPLQSNAWTWSADVGTEGANIVSGGDGTLTFDAYGNLDTFAYTGGVSSLQFLTNNGSDMVDFTIEPGEFGTIEGLSQFAGAESAVVRSQDGYSSGSLNDMTIANNGEITGFFSNGVSQNLGQIMLASFNNPNGLTHMGNNLYDVSPNSGAAITGVAGGAIQSKIVSGNLEQSNVELTQEFSKMVLAQRGFQANARVLTTSDQLLQEVVSLKR
jgi:flagellar hook protein FlgE